MISRPRSLQVFLLLACGVAAVNAGEPAVVMGAGTISCKEYVALLKDPHKPHSIDAVLSWVQGYFSARNTAGRRGQDVLTVGGTMSAATLQSMLADQCAEERLQPLPLVIAVNELYEKLQQKGL